MQKHNSSPMNRYSSSNLADQQPASSHRRQAPTSVAFQNPILSSVTSRDRVDEMAHYNSLQTKSGKTKQELLESLNIKDMPDQGVMVYDSGIKYTVSHKDLH